MGNMPNTYRLAIFDFDGTLADSFPFFVSTFNQLAARHRFSGIAPCDIPQLRRYSARQLMRHVGMPAWKMPFVANSFRALMEENQAGIALFDGVGELLQELTQQGVTLAVVSSNSRANVERILGPGHAQLIHFFECGASIFGKAAPLRRVLRKSGIPASEAIYIGDQATDLEAARKARLACGAVAWGYGDIDALRAYSPDLEFHAVAEIGQVAKGW